MGLCCCKDWRGHLRAPKGNSGRARAPRCSRRHNPRPGPHVLLLPAPARLCRGSRALTLAGASPNSATRGKSRGYARNGAAWGSRAVGGHGRQVHQVHRCTGPRGPRSTAVADRLPTRPTRPAPATLVWLYRPERGGPFILLIRLCHSLGLRGPDSEFSKVAAEPASGAASGM